MVCSVPDELRVGTVTASRLSLSMRSESWSIDGRVQARRIFSSPGGNVDGYASGRLRKHEIPKTGDKRGCSDARICFHARLLWRFGVVEGPCACGSLSRRILSPHRSSPVLPTSADAAAGNATSARTLALPRRLGGHSDDIRHAHRVRRLYLALRGSQGRKSTRGIAAAAFRLRGASAWRTRSCSTQVNSGLTSRPSGARGLRLGTKGPLGA